MPASFAEKNRIGVKETVTKIKIMDKATRKICKAISLGVFFRAAPSTIAIILSRKLSPASLVTLTTIQSDRTVVPPVTALRSPPASRITGGGFAGDGAFIHGGRPFYDFSICRNLFSSLDNHQFAFFSRADGTTVMLSFCSAEGILCASTSFREARKESACAFTTAFCNGLRKVSKQNGKPKDNGNRQSKAAWSVFYTKEDTTQKRWSRSQTQTPENMTGFSACVLGLNFEK